MNKYLFLFIFILLSNISFSQAYYPYQDIKLEKPSDYAETEPMALSAATLLITTPYNETDAGRKSAMQFLTTWMMGTKVYTFYLHGIVEDISEDRNLFGLYIAALAKYTFENKTEAANPLIAESNACKILLSYCDDEKNDFRLKKKYRKLVEKHAGL